MIIFDLSRTFSRLVPSQRRPRWCSLASRCYGSLLHTRPSRLRM